MASTEEQNPVVTNGNHVDSDDEDLSKMRPVDIDQDVREMERRKRVINCFAKITTYRCITIKFLILQSNK